MPTETCDPVALTHVADLILSGVVVMDTGTWVVPGCGPAVYQETLNEAAAFLKRLGMEAQ